MAAWGIHGDKTSVISAPNYQVSYMKIKKNHICSEIPSSLVFSWKVFFFFFKSCSHLKWLLSESVEDFYPILVLGVRMEKKISVY